MALASGGVGLARPRRIPRWFLLVIGVLVVAIAIVTFEAVQLDHALHQTRCDSAKATARAVLNGSDKVSPDAISRALAAACTGKGQREIFDL